MKPLRRRNGNQHLHRASLDYRNAIKRKIHAYHVFIQAGVVCQGLLQYLAVAFPKPVWNSFGSCSVLSAPASLHPSSLSPCVTPEPARISLACRPNQLPREIHCRKATPRWRRDVPNGRMTSGPGTNSGLLSNPKSVSRKIGAGADAAPCEGVLVIVGTANATW